MCDEEYQHFIDISKYIDRDVIMVKEENKGHQCAEYQRGLLIIKLTVSENKKLKKSGLDLLQY